MELEQSRKAEYRLMNWGEAHRVQALADFEHFRKLNQAQSIRCHQLLFLQMASEKLAKSYLCDQKKDKPYKATHLALVLFLKTLKKRPDIQRRLGYEYKQRHFIEYIDGIMPIAEQIQGLAPVGGNFLRMNAEYPWEGIKGRPIVPCQYGYVEIFEVDFPRFQRFLILLGHLFEIATSDI